MEIFIFFNVVIFSWKIKILKSFFFLFTGFWLDIFLSKNTMIEKYSVKKSNEYFLFSFQDNIMVNFKFTVKYASTTSIYVNGNGGKRKIVVKCSKTIWYINTSIFINISRSQTPWRRRDNTWSCKRKKNLIKHKIEKKKKIAGSYNRCLVSLMTIWKNNQWY